MVDALDKLKSGIGGGKGLASLFGIDKNDITRLRNNMAEVVKELQELNRKMDKVIKLLEEIKNVEKK